MKAIILAAGCGTRIRKYTEGLPKGMLSFQGKTLIERQVELYRQAGIERICICTGYAAQAIVYPDVTYYHNARFAETNMVETLMCAREEFDDDVVVSYSDVLFERMLLDGMVSSEHDFAVAVDDAWKPYWNARYGRVDFDTESLSIDPSGNITELGLENPDLGSIDARYIGLLRFTERGLSTICDVMEEAFDSDSGQPWMQSGKPVRQAYMTDLLEALIRRGERVHAERFSGGWIEFDTDGDYDVACRWAAEGTLGRFIKLTDKDCR